WRPARPGVVAGASAADALGADGDVVVPEGVGVGAVALPAEPQVDQGRVPSRPVQPLAVDVVRRHAVDDETLDQGAVDPGAQIAAGDLELDAGPGVDRQGPAHGHAVGTLLGQRRVIGFAVPLQGAVLSAQAQVGAGVGGVLHGDHRGVGGRLLGGVTDVDAEPLGVGGQFASDEDVVAVRRPAVDPDRLRAAAGDGVVDRG